jgi:hypothetical protein
MDWIKKNYDQGLLALLAFALIGISALLFLNANNFKEKFADAAAVPTLNRKLPELDTAAIEATKQKLDAPKLWSSGNHQNLLFTSEPYIVENGQLKPIRGGAFLHHTETGEEIPNEWWKQYGISVTGESILTEDPDGDGFVNQDEWKFNTDPHQKRIVPSVHHPAVPESMDQSSLPLQVSRGEWRPQQTGDHGIPDQPLGRGSGNSVCEARRAD